MGEEASKNGVSNSSHHSPDTAAILSGKSQSTCDLVDNKTPGQRLSHCLPEISRNNNNNKPRVRRQTTNHDVRLTRHLIYIYLYIY